VKTLSATDPETAFNVAVLNNFRSEEERLRSIIERAQAELWSKPMTGETMTNVMNILGEA
jgi:hypothetical protein